jgi:hypothetical protein
MLALLRYGASGQPLFMEEHMTTVRKFVIPTLIVLMGLFVVPGASGQDAQAGTKTEIERGRVEWTLSPDQCSHIDDKIMGTGQRLRVIATITRRDGSKEVVDNDFVTGTATDDDGKKYRFIYSNQAHLRIPKDGSPVRVHMTDTFDLQGNRGKNNLNTGFIWDWTYNPDDGEEIWPPAHNLRKTLTFGDPEHCDPI